jgi:hypothetical protein
MLEFHSVFSIIRDFQQKAIPYQYSTPPGEKCGLDPRLVSVEMALT